MTFLVQYVDSKSGEFLSVYNPNDETLVVEGVHAAGAEDVDAAVDAATKAFKEWRKWSGPQRAKVMMKMADLIERDADKLARFEVMCMGQPITVARKFLSGVAPYWRYYAGFCDKIEGEYFPEDGDARVKITQYMPFGVCAGIGMYR